MLEYALLAGFLFGLYFSLVGLGLNLMFGVMRIVNLAHGDFLMLGGFTAYWLFTLFHINPIVSVLIAFVGFTVIGAPMYYLGAWRLATTKDPEMLSLILFFGLSQVIEAAATVAFGASQYSIPGVVLGAEPWHVLGQTFPASWMISGIASLVFIALLYVYLYRTRLGYLTRAVMASRDEALSTGINVHFVSSIAFGLSLGLAAVAGVFAPFMLGSILPSMGASLNITAFAVIVVGALGEPLGTVLGGIIYGIGLMLMQTYFSSWANLLPYLLLILILLVKPTGLLGKKVRRA
jgi:branched-chain amino acid transport system permease protein